MLSNTPAWPMMSHPAVPAPPTVWVYRSKAEDVRVATHEGKFFVSYRGGNFAGPFNTLDDAREYGERIDA